MNLAEIKARINPVYVDQIGTESHERKWLCDRIDELAEALAICKQHMARDQWDALFIDGALRKIKP